MNNSFFYYIFKESMVPIYIGIAGFFVAIAIVFITPLVKRNLKLGAGVFLCAAVLFVGLSIYASFDDKLDYSNQESGKMVNELKETISSTDRVNGKITIIEERNEGNTYSNYDEINVTSDFNSGFVVTDCGSISIKGEHNEDFSITECDSVTISSHNDNFIIKSCKEVEVTGSHNNAIIIFNCPKVRILDGYNKVYLIDSKLVKKRGSGNNIYEMTLDEFINSDMGYVMGENK